MLYTKQNIYRILFILFEESRKNTLKKYLGKIIYDENFTISMAEKLNQNNKRNLLKDLYNECYKIGSELDEIKENIWSSQDILEVLLRTNIPLITGDWKRNRISNGHVLLQEQCPFDRFSFKFKYWEKAISGLVSGLNSSVHYVVSNNLKISKKKKPVIHTIYDSNFFGEQFEEMPKRVMTLVNSLNQSLGKYDINLVLDGYMDGYLYYHIKGFSINSLGQVKERMITEAILNFVKLKTKDLKFIEVIK